MPSGFHANRGRPGSGNVTYIEHHRCCMIEAVACLSGTELRSVVRQKLNLRQFLTNVFQFSIACHSSMTPRSGSKLIARVLTRIYRELRGGKAGQNSRMHASVLLSTTTKTRASTSPVFKPVVPTIGRGRAVVRSYFILLNWMEFSFYRLVQPNPSQSLRWQPQRH